MKFKNIQYLVILIIVMGILSSCEDVITVETDVAEPTVVVEAWLDNEVRGQTIRLSMSQPYFDNSKFEPLTGAVVQISTSHGKLFNFNELEGGEYVWLPIFGDSLGPVGTTFELSVDWSGQQFYANTQVRRVPQIDSIGQEFEEESIFGPAGIRTQFYARDPLGLGDTYWIKSYKNGRFLDKPSEINIAYDAGFDAGAQIDGLIFIPPIRNLTNPEADEDNEDEPPWKSDDLIEVEIHSISNDAFFFLETMRDQLSNGDNGIFSIPLANPKSNVYDRITGEPILGIFNVAEISSASDRIN